MSLLPTMRVDRRDTDGHNKAKTSHAFDAGLQAAWSSLSQIALDENLFALAFGAAFGSLSSSRSWREKQRKWANGQFDGFPVVEVLPAARLLGVEAAFAKSTNKIYISEEFLLSNQNNSSIIAAVLLREYGHYLDWKLNPYNRPGKEGVFSRLARHGQPSGAEMAQFNAATMLLDKARSESRKIGLEIHASHGWTDSKDIDAAASSPNENATHLGDDGQGSGMISGSIVNPSKKRGTNQNETKPAARQAIITADYLQSINDLDLSDAYSIASLALQKSYDYLSKFYSDPEYRQKLRTAFGIDFHQNIADRLFANFAQGSFSTIPVVRIVSRAAIAGGNGAFSADTGFIYLAAEFIKENYRSSSRIADVLLEEMGHFVDSQINQMDSPGDEGEIFSSLVQGEILADEELRILRNENDIATVISNGQGITILPGSAETAIEKNKPLRVGTWNIYYGEGKKGKIAIPEPTRRINYIAQYGMKNNVDIIVLQEVPNGSNTPLVDELNIASQPKGMDIIENPKYSTEGLNTMVGGYKYLAIPSEYITRSTVQHSTTKEQVGYLILYNAQTINIILQKSEEQANQIIPNSGNAASYFSYKAFEIDNTQYRPPILIKAKKGTTTYDLLTWHNEAPGPAAKKQVKKLEEILSKSNQKTVLLGDLNVENPTLPEGYFGVSEGKYDVIITNNVDPVKLNTGNLSEERGLLYSDAHGALFADIHLSSSGTIVNNTRVVSFPILDGNGISPKNYDKEQYQGNPIKYEYSGNQPAPSWENELLQIGKNQAFFTPLTTVDGGKVTIREKTENGKTKKYIDVKANSSNKNAKVYSAIGTNQSSALFNGEVSFDTTTLAGTITDKGDSDASGFKLIGGIEVSFDGLSFSENANGNPQLRLQGSMLLPKGLVGGNGLLVAINGNDYIGMSDNGLEVTGGFVKLPGETTFVALGLLEIKALDAQVKFDFTNEEITLQGKFSIPTLKNATFDLQGENYIKVKKTESGLAFSMVASASIAKIPLFGSWEIQDIKLDVDSTKNNFAINAKLKTPGSSIGLVLGFENGRLNTVTGTSGVGTDFNFLGAAIDIRTVATNVDRNRTDNEPWDPEFSLQGEIIIPTLKGLKGTLSGNHKLVVNKEKAYLTGAQLSAADISIGKWKLKQIQASFQEKSNSFTGTATLQTYDKDIAVSLAFDESGLKNITATNVTFGLFGAQVSGASFNFKPDRKPTEGETWDPEFKIQGTIILPSKLGEIIVNGNDYLMVNSDGLVLSGAKIYRERLDLRLAGLRVLGEKISLEITTINNVNSFQLQGKITLPDFYNLTGDFSGSQYIIAKSNGDIEVVGTISASNVVIAPGWKIKNASLSFNSWCCYLMEE
jgi:hypothetical protein